jgi:hypothetical protein
MGAWRPPRACGARRVQWANPVLDRRAKNYLSPRTLTEQYFLLSSVSPAGNLYR